MVGSQHRSARIRTAVTLSVVAIGALVAGRAFLNMEHARDRQRLWQGAARSVEEFQHAYRRVVITQKQAWGSRQKDDRIQYAATVSLATDALEELGNTEVPSGDFMAMARHLQQDFDIACAHQQVELQRPAPNVAPREKTDALVEQDVLSLRAEAFEQSRLAMRQILPSFWVFVVSILLVLLINFLIRILSDRRGRT